MTNFRELQNVVLLRDLDASYIIAPGLGKPGAVDGHPAINVGTHGVIVDLQSQDDFTVEFFDDLGETIGISDIPAAFVRAATDADYPVRVSPTS